MCGITGKVYFKRRCVDIAAIEKMNAALSHRGPDDKGIYVSSHQLVGLGHQRLSVIDLSPAAHQPMRYLHRYVITFNGEIYNYQALRHRLIQQGYRFASMSDTEVILALYDAYQTQCVHHLQGMFAFAIYDEQKQRLFCVRDRLGKKPFKYYLDQQVLIFASEIKAILTQSDVSIRADLGAINQYLTWQYVPAPSTGFRNIYKLPPAHALEVDLNNGQHKVYRYWSPVFSSFGAPRSTEEWMHELRSAIQTAVQRRLVADVPVGAFLSGGADSAAIVALMAQQSRQPIKTFTVGFSSDDHDESAWARLVAKQLGTEHAEIIIQPDALDIVRLIANHFDEPFADSSAIPTYYVSRLARRQVTVVLTGDGGDELFAGYRHYAAHRIANAMQYLPGAAALGYYIAPLLNPRWQRFAESLSKSAIDRHISYLAYFTPAMKAQLYALGFPQTSGHDNDNLLSTTFSSFADPVEAAIAFDTQTYLPEDILAKVDMMTMSVGLEARSPLLDQRVVELAAQLPLSLKLSGWRHHKYIWKRAMHDLVPKLVLHRPKHGFTIPLSDWLRGPLHELLVSTLTSPQLAQRGLFQIREIKRLIVAHQRHTPSLARPLWGLLMLELWFQNYID